MTDLVDYLRDKLEHADVPECSCDWADVCDLRGHGGHERPHKYLPGRRDPKCPLHGDECRCHDGKPVPVPVTEAMARSGMLRGEWIPWETKDCPIHREKAVRR